MFASFDICIRIGLRPLSHVSFRILPKEFSFLCRIPRDNNNDFFVPYNTPLRCTVCIFLIFLEWPSPGLFVKMVSSPAYFLLLPLWLWYVQFCFRRLSSFLNLLGNIHIIKHIVGLLIGIHLKVSSL